MNDNTVIMHSSFFGKRNANRIYIVSTDITTGAIRESEYTKSFIVGRSDDSDFVVDHIMVSRHHISVYLKYGEWFIKDLNSTNGVFLNNEKLLGDQKLQLPCSVFLGGERGATIILDLLSRKESMFGESMGHGNDQTQFVKQDAVGYLDDKFDKEKIRHKLFGEDSRESGEYTQMVRQVVTENKKREVNKYKLGLVIVTFLLVISVSITAFQKNHYRNIAINMFYQIKSLNVDIALLETRLDHDVNDSLKKSILSTKRKLEGMQNEYDKLVADLNSLKFPSRVVRLLQSKINPNIDYPSEYTRELIQRVAEKFGESRLELSEDFIMESYGYILKWKRSSRLEKAIAQLETNNYKKIIIKAMNKEGLPLQFLYLCLQESNFNTKAIGPETKYGIAKGAWQFLPETAREFGLYPGNKTDDSLYDTVDERFDFSKATYAAAKYLKKIYATEAQASGLLVIAGYNYGHNRVKGMIKKLPNTPKARNYWNFISTYKIPDETYQYVLYIFSAAVIGEDPEYFGFKFKSPTTF